MSSSKLSDLFRLRNYILDQWREDKSYFLGRVLTIIDASISDPEQRKGIKDLIKGAYYEHSYHETEVKEILLSFADKHCPKTSPATNDENDAFMGKLPVAEVGKPEYFKD